MSRKLMNLQYLGLAVVLAAILAVAGCSGDSPLAPDTGQEAGFNKFMAAAVNLENPVAPASVEVSQLIDASDGGEIPIDKEFFEHSFAVEPSAVDQDVNIDVRAVDDVVAGRNAVVFEFGPDGLVFKESSKLNFQMADISARALVARLYYYDPSVKDWVLQSMKPVSNGYVTFEIDHFSKYAISD